MAIVHVRDRYRERFDQGFTLVELVVILILVGILAVAVMPRFADKGGFDARGFFDATASILRYAQKSAVAQRHPVCVAFGADSSVTLSLDVNSDATCSGTLAGPDGEATYSLSAPSSGVGFAAQPGNFRFLPSGAASVDQTITVNGLSGRSIIVWAATGYVQEN